MLLEKSKDFFIKTFYRTKSSSIRGKMSLLQNSIANYTRLIESLSIIRSQSNHYEEMSEENKDYNLPHDDMNGERLSSTHEKKL